MKSLNSPKMSTAKSNFKKRLSDMSNHLKQIFNPLALNRVWTNSFSYILIENKMFVYVCAILDLFSRKIIA